MIIVPNIKDKQFAILGLGKTGLATAASLKASGAQPVLWDDNAKARAEAEQAGYKVADISDPSSFEALIMSPGIPLTHPKPHPVAAAFKEANKPVIGDIELLFRACPQATFVAITGTNGKSTTTALTAHILSKAGKKVQVGGNLGTPVLTFDQLGTDGIYVLELSSYQLDLIQQNPIKVAVLLNITPDHLDRHGGMEGYIAAKSRIISSTTPQTFIIGIDEDETRALSREARRRKNVKVEEISVKYPVEHGAAAIGSDLVADGKEKIMDLSTLKTLPGSHNWQNACAAFAATRALGIPTTKIIEGLQTFPGLAHRQQLVGEISGVRFINDSKATNADAASKALGCYDAIYWIIGGKPKEGGLSGLEPLMNRVVHAYIIGAASEQFAAWCAKNKVAHTLCGTLNVAVEKAAATALRDKKPGSVVLLSPACASFDQFNNFEERGKLFADLAQGLRTAGAA